jgi:hypothetical protein
MHCIGDASMGLGQIAGAYIAEVKRVRGQKNSGVEQIGYLHIEPIA